mmetsp:Transcript_43221/g.112023  ORF Transcript_43221/g.112023 Transcript_43221/m.112023 type:complete len:318 (+) Transcript_43221:761-1714(+)
MQCAVNLLLPVSDALQFIEGNTTRVSFVYLIMLHIGNDVAQWTSGALDGVLLDGQEPLSVKAFRAFHARWGATGRIQAGLYDDVHMVAYFLDPFLCRLVEELPLNAIGAFQKIFGKFCDDVELAQCVNESMKFHNGDGGYGMMKDFAEQTHQREFARLKEKYLRDHNLGKLPHCVSEAIMYCQAAMSNGNCAITWWKTMGKTVKSAKKLSEIAVRVLSLAPTATPVERMNSIHKLIQTKGRAALKHQRVVKLMFCYVNMRLLDSIDEEMVGMIEDMLLQEMAAMDAAAASSNVTGNATNREGDIGDAALANVDEGAG